MSEYERSNKPILITGCPRSGTTFCGRIISKSDDIFEVYEPFNPDFHYNLNLPTKFHQFTSSNDDAHKKALKSLFDLAHLSKRLSKLPMGSLAGLRFKHSGRADRIDHILSLRKLKVESSKFWKANRLSLKDPVAFFSAPWIAKQHDAHVVTLVRHPGGVISSFLKLGWEPETKFIVDNTLPISDGMFKDDIARWRDNPDDIVGALILQWKIFTQATLDYHTLYPEWSFVLHDELCSHPQETFGRIFNNIGLPMTATVRETIKDYTSGQNTVDPKVHNQHMLKRSSADLLNSWKDRLSPEITKRIMLETQELWSQAQSTFAAIEPPPITQSLSA